MREASLRAFSFALPFLQNSKNDQKIGHFFSRVNFNHSNSFYFSLFLSFWPRRVWIFEMSVSLRESESVTF